MKKHLLIVGICLCIIHCAFANTYAIEFSADMITKTAGNSYSGKIYMKGDKIRTDTPGQSSYSIVRQDKNVVWLVTPEKKSYLEMPYDPTQKPEAGEKVKGEVSRKLIGKEIIDGHPTEKYLITSKDAGKTREHYQWVATDLNFPIKTAAVDGSYSVEYRNIKKSVSDSMFELPSGYQKMTIPAMPKMGGMKKK